MTTKMTTLIEQFSLVEGAWRNSPHNQAAVREPRRGKPGKGNLFVLVEAQGQISKLELVEKRLVALVRDTYYPANGGVTTSLRRAMKAANLWLYQQNRMAGDKKPVVAGVVAVVIRDEDLFVAQAGPTALLSALGQTVQRYPETSGWLDQQPAGGGDEIDPALGVHHYAAPRISHLQLQVGDVIILTDGRLAKYLTQEKIWRVIRGQSVEIISQNLARAAQVGSGSAMVIQITPADTIKKPTWKPAKKAPVGVAFGDKKGFNFSLPNILSGLSGPASTKSAAKQRYEPTEYHQANNEPDDYQELDFDQDDGSRSQATAGGSGLPASQLSQGARNILVVILGAVAFLGSGLYTILKLVLPGSQGEPATRQKAGARVQAAAVKRPSSTALKYVAIGLPILVLLATLLVYWYRGYSRENTYTTMVSGVQEKVAQAQSAAPETAITLLAEAEQQLTEAATLKEGQTEVESLQTSIATQRDEIGRVERLYYMPELRRYTDPGTQLNRAIVQGVDVYVLDTGLDRLFHHTLDDIGDTLLPDDGNPVLLQRGQNLERAVVGDIVDMVWMPAAGGRRTSGLLILTRDGLLEFNTDWGASPIPISGVQLWQTPVAASSYFGNFYLLDTQANLLHRYWPTLDGYENPSENYFPEGTFVDLSGAVDMAIDGHIYILFRHGEIKKFLGGEPAPFQVKGLDIPFNNPTAIYTAPDEEAQYLYVADAGNQRIVQLSKEGEFIRQFKPREEDGVVFNDLRSIYVDEISEKMFVLNGFSLYAPNIPAR